MQLLPPHAGTLAITVVVLLNGCSSMRITSDYDPQTNFAGLRTFDWLSREQQPTGDPRVDNSLIDTRIRRAVEAQLDSNGFQKRDRKKPDFLVTYHAFLDTKLDFSRTNERSRYGGRERGGQVYVRQYEQGTLMLDVIHPTTKELMWRGIAEAVVNPYSTPEKSEKKIREAVRRILERFPPKQIQ